MENKEEESKAGKNEKDFKNFIEKNSNLTLKGKKGFSGQNTYISVDEYFEYNGKKVYVEIDSGNMAKLIAGQYILLNILGKFDKDSIFLVIHYYTDYNPQRTKNVLECVNKNALDNKGVKFIALHINEFKQLVKDRNLKTVIK